MTNEKRTEQLTILVTPTERALIESSRAKKDSKTRLKWGMVKELHSRIAFTLALQEIEPDIDFEARVSDPHGWKEVMERQAEYEPFRKDLRQALSSEAGSLSEAFAILDREAFAPAALANAATNAVMSGDMECSNRLLMNMKTNQETANPAPVVEVTAEFRKYVARVEMQDFDNTDVRQARSKMRLAETAKGIRSWLSLWLSLQCHDMEIEAHDALNYRLNKRGTDSGPEIVAELEGEYSKKFAALKQEAQHLMGALTPYLAEGV